MVDKDGNPIDVEPGVHLMEVKLDVFISENETNVGYCADPRLFCGMVKDRSKDGAGVNNLYSLYT